jgi:hypothetical protein
LALVAGLAFALGGTSAFGQQPYPTPAAAAEAFVDAVARHDNDALKKVIGHDYAKYLPHANASDTTDFLAAWAKSNRIVAAGDDKAYLEVGRSGWTLPIPIVKTAGGWQFDTHATAEELRVRRIGRNEMSVIQVMLAYRDAQEDYATYDRNRNGRADYAQRLLSSPGRQDGLYWPTRPGEPESPLGSEFAASKAGDAYRGYHYRILTAQGPDAPGGAKRYVGADGAMTGGYALVAWPAKWGDTGVMSFIVSKDGIVYEKDLGPDSDRIVRSMTAFNPDASWRKSTIPD